MTPINNNQMSEKVLDILNKHKVVATESEGLRPLCKDISTLISRERAEAYERGLKDGYSNCIGDRIKEFGNTLKSKEILEEYLSNERKKI